MFSVKNDQPCQKFAYFIGLLVYHLLDSFIDTTTFCFVINCFCRYLYQFLFPAFYLVFIF